MRIPSMSRSLVVAAALVAQLPCAPAFAPPMLRTSLGPATAATSPMKTAIIRTRQEYTPRRGGGLPMLLKSSSPTNFYAMSRSRNELRSGSA